MQVKLSKLNSQPLFREESMCFVLNMIVYLVYVYLVQKPRINSIYTCRRFSYSTPKKISDLSPFLNKWSPKIHDVVSIIEEVINTSNDNNDDEDDVTSDTNRSDEVNFFVLQSRFV